VTKSTHLPAPAETPAPQHGCPFRWRGHCAIADDILPATDRSSDARYLQVRRQGIYLAACIIDDVAELGIASPEAVIDEIRRRVCELVRLELKESSVNA
jgi:hypothetical protein